MQCAGCNFSTLRPRLLFHSVSLFPSLPLLFSRVSSSFFELLHLGSPRRSFCTIFQFGYQRPIFSMTSPPLPPTFSSSPRRSSFTSIYGAACISDLREETKRGRCSLTRIPEERFCVAQLLGSLDTRRRTGKFPSWVYASLNSSLSGVILRVKSLMSCRHRRRRRRRRHCYRVRQSRKYSARIYFS